MRNIFKKLFKSKNIPLTKDELRDIMILIAIHTEREEISTEGKLRYSLIKNKILKYLCKNF